METAGVSGHRRQRSSEQAASGAPTPSLPGPATPLAPHRPPPLYTRHAPPKPPHVSTRTRGPSALSRGRWWGCRARSRRLSSRDKMRWRETPPPPASTARPRLQRRGDSRAWSMEQWRRRQAAGGSMASASQRRRHRRRQPISTAPTPQRRHSQPMSSSACFRARALSPLNRARYSASVSMAIVARRSWLCGAGVGGRAHRGGWAPALIAAHASFPKHLLRDRAPACASIAQARPTATRAHLQQLAVWRSDASGGDAGRPGSRHSGLGCPEAGLAVAALKRCSAVGDAAAVDGRRAQRRRAGRRCRGRAGTRRHASPGDGPGLAAAVRAAVGATVRLHIQQDH